MGTDDGQHRPRSAGATPLLQNIILYPYVNPATEILDATGMPSSLDVTPISSAADGTQIWKITHNGVDTHPIHFHLYDVQVLNRVTWDNIIIPPEPTELGWKDTVRVSPLEDTIVALRPIVPTLPFGVPDSNRPLNPMMPIGARGDVERPQRDRSRLQQHRHQRQPDRRRSSTRSSNFGWEYVFHCHILSHEEMDMMRPVTVHVPCDAPPDAPVLTFTRGSVILNWTDGNAGRLPRPDHLGQLERRRSASASSGPRSTDGSRASFTKVATAPANSDHVHRHPAGPDDHVRLPGHRLQRGRSGFVERGQGRRTAREPDRR